LKLPECKNLLVGFETNDDAGVFKIKDDYYIVQTVDFITPVVDDPYIFGRISAINSLSDVYAMGANPLTALSVLMYNCDIDEKIIGEMMQGAVDELASSNCALLGGHTVDDHEIKLGFAVTGFIDDGKIYKNCTLREGDLLVYTKPLGIGILTTAIKGEVISESALKQVTNAMLLSNKKASEIFKQFDVSAVTDVTGFGLAGHAFEMAKGSSVSLEIYMDNLKIFDEAKSLAQMGIIPAGAYYNKQFLTDNYDFVSDEKDNEIIVFDPQTSGGLLIGVSFTDGEKLLSKLIESGYEDSSIIGIVTQKSDKYLVFK
jgi:selenide,water dikinase